MNSENEQKWSSRLICTNNEFEVEDGSNIVQYFDGKSVFLTGATGFLGKLILEKILRACKNIKQLYILVRPKKGVNINDRIDLLFSSAAMDLMKKENPNFKEKITMVSGDLVLPYLGMSVDSIQKFKDEINIVIHCGATVRFDQKIKEATYINIRAVKHLIEISKETKGLESFLYISTAYSNCPRSEIGEVFYDPPIKPENMLKLVEIIDEKKLIEMTPILIGEWPNTYAFTKSIAENLIRQEGENLPLAIVRPSIIIGAVKEPIPGWTDSIYGPTGVLLFGLLGILRTMHGDSSKKSDLVPVDYVVNCIIAAAYQRAKLRHMPEARHNGEITPIYNYCYSPNLPPLTWGNYVDGVRQIPYDKLASTRCLWWPKGELRKNKYLFKFEVFLNMIPAYCADFIFMLTGKEQKAVKLMQKLFYTVSVLNYFTTRNWVFSTNNTQELFKSLNPDDQNLFDFDMDKFDFKTHILDYLIAIRVYMVNDPMETLEAGKRHLLKLRIIYYLSWILLCALIYFVYSFVRNYMLL